MKTVYLTIGDTRTRLKRPWPHQLSRRLKKLKNGAYVVAEVIPVHTSECGVSLKRHRYTCTCGVHDAFDKLIGQDARGRTKR